MVSDIEFGKLQADVANIQTLIAKFDKTIFGNGKEGLYDMTKNQSVKLDEMNKRLDDFIDELRDTKAGVEGLEETVENHLTDPKRTFKFFIVDNWKAVLSIVIGIYLVLELILPVNFTLWSLIEKLF